MIVLFFLNNFGIQRMQGKHPSIIQNILTLWTVTKYELLIAWINCLPKIKGMSEKEDKTFSLQLTVKRII